MSEKQANMLTTTTDQTAVLLMVVLSGQEIKESISQSIKSIEDSKTFSFLDF